MVTGPLPDPIGTAIKKAINRRCSAVRNRNFEGRIHPLVKTNWLASPPLVITYAWREISISTWLLSLFVMMVKAIRFI
ncbi:aconitase family protein [Shigella flexneri]